MKKFIVIFISSLFIFGCSDSDILSPHYQSIYREIAYNSLDEQSKESLTSSWYEAKVKEGVYKQEEESHIILFTSETGISFFLRDNITLSRDQKLIAVSFNTKYDPLLGPMMIIIDPRRNAAVGIVGRL